ncbi:heme-binding protein [Flavobacteriaceae bacterium]|jgi:hypothetical protein|nr:heme-binding protein [Flavobacteriaceae bacterium]MDC3245983.1 heme-binding protein [Flavobacteriaceae bacterium]
MIKCVLLFISITMFSQGYETQKYEVVKKLNEIEVRFYPPVMKAKVSAGSNFSRLFKYISGNNEQGEKISMTTPVQMTNQDNVNTMEFILPSRYSEDNFAIPKDKNITVYNSDPGHFAAITYGGYSNTEKVKKYHSLLLKKLRESNLEVINSKPVVLSYNSPYKVFNRRNEVLVEVKY